MHPVHDPFDDGRALQDRLQAHCFGCGTLNEQGLHIKSRWEGDEFVCIWQPRPEHIGLPGYVNGGTITSVVNYSVRPGLVECTSTEVTTVRVKALG